jgi:hypothetical protein
MSSYTIVIQGQSGLEANLKEILNNIQRMDVLLDQLADEVILPILAQHYDSSGIKQSSPQASMFGGSQGLLKQAVTKRGAFGNTIEKSPGHLTVGVSYQDIPYARWVLEGRGPVKPVNKKVLHWVDANGKDVFAKSVGPAPAHAVYFLTPEELGRVEVALEMKLTRSQGLGS